MKMVGIRMDDNTLKALDRVQDHQSKIQLHRVTMSECIRFLIMKEAQTIEPTVNKKT